MKTDEKNTDTANHLESYQSEEKVIVSTQGILEEEVRLGLVPGTEQSRSLPVLLTLGLTFLLGLAAVLYS